MFTLQALTVLLAVGVGWLWVKAPGRNQGTDQDHVEPRRRHL
jgi:hypothetical protein